MAATLRETFRLLPSSQWKLALVSISRAAARPPPCPASLLKPRQKIASNGSNTATPSSTSHSSLPPSTKRRSPFSARDTGRGSVITAAISGKHLQAARRQGDPDVLGTQAWHGFRGQLSQQRVAGQLFQFKPHAAAVAKKRDLANLGREQVFFMHRRVDADGFRAAEQAPRS